MTTVKLALTEPSSTPFTEPLSRRRSLVSLLRSSTSPLRGSWYCLWDFAVRGNWVSSTVKCVLPRNDDMETGCVSNVIVNLYQSTKQNQTDTTPVNVSYLTENKMFLLEINDLGEPTNIKL